MAACGTESVNVEALGLALASSSTNTRISQLAHLEEHIQSEALGTLPVSSLLRLLFTTHPFYQDRESRRAVQKCLGLIFVRKELSTQEVAPFMSDLDDNCAKASIALSSAFVLLEWCSLLTQLLVGGSLWQEFGPQILIGHARVLAKCVGSDSRKSLAHSAIVVTRRGLRRLAAQAIDHDSQILAGAVKLLSAQAAKPVSSNIILLGVVAGVSARMERAKQIVDGLKPEYFAFYTREIIGSRTTVPVHIASGLRDFWQELATEEDFENKIAPSLEKGLLRAPEIVLKDIMGPLVSSLPDSYDLTKCLISRLLKPILTNVKSSNPDVRSGAVTSFRAILAKSHNHILLHKVAEEIVELLKSGKLATPEQKIAHAQMLASMTLSEDAAERTALALATAALKEGNEAALGFETMALAQATMPALRSNGPPKSIISDAFVKGLSDKKHGLRRFWILRAGEILHSYGNVEKLTPAMSEFAELVFPKLLDSFNNAITNPSAASQNGLAVGGFVACALSGVLQTKSGGLFVGNATRKNSIFKQCLALEPKPSFLLSPRIYTKLSKQEDMLWLVRALFAASEHLSESAKAVNKAWAQAFVYAVCSPGLLPASRQEASKALSKAYAIRKALVSGAVIDALWELVGRWDGPSDEAETWLNEGGDDNLNTVLRSIFPSPKESSGLGQDHDQDQLTRQLCSVIALARPRLLPRGNWIDLCLRTEIDPGTLVKEHASALLEEIVSVTAEQPALSIRNAAYEAAAELAFISPENMMTRIVVLVTKDLRPEELRDVTPLDVSIMKASRDVPVVDVLAKRGAASVVNKNTKDYDIMKWEAETRARIQENKGQVKSLTADEITRTSAQLKVEAAIRKRMRALQARLQRGIGIAKSLAIGPPTDPILWLSPVLNALVVAIDAGACMMTASSAPKAYISCADKLSSRLGAMRPFIGAATLRARGVTSLPKEYKEEPLEHLVTRVLYRLRFAGEQRPFDAVSFIYVLPLVLYILRQGGVGTDSEEREIQLVLAIEFLSFHTDVCADESIDRAELLSVLVTSMRTHAHQYKALRDTFTDMCRCIAPNMSTNEMQILAKANMAPEASVRTTVLQCISAEVDMSELPYSDEIWLASHDEVEENSMLGREVWEESGFELSEETPARLLSHLESKDAYLRGATARALAGACAAFPSTTDFVLGSLLQRYTELAKPRVQTLDEFGMPKKMDLSDPWEGRQGVGAAIKELSGSFNKSQLDLTFRFLLETGPLSDRNSAVRGEMLGAALRAIEHHGKNVVGELMDTFEHTLEESDKSSEMADLVSEAVVIMYGALAGHLKAGDAKIPTVIERLLHTLNTPSETVQYAIADCLPPLIRAYDDRSSKYFDQILDSLLTSKTYATQRGAAYGLSGLVVGRGICVLRDYRIISTLKGAAENKKEASQREAAFLGIELLSAIAGRLFEPYVIEIVPMLLAGFGDSNANVRESCLAAAKACFAKLTSYGVKKIMPTLLHGLDDQQWRSKKGACDLLGAMAYLDPHQLAQSLPDIIPPLTGVLNDSHKEVRSAANKSLKRFGEVIKNPEVKVLVDILLKALSDPTRYTEEALDALIKVQFVHYLDAPSLALVIRILHRGLADRSNTKRKASQVIGSLAHLTERKDIISHLPTLIFGLKNAAVDPVPTTRATASRALGSLVEKLGEDAMPDLIPGLMHTLKSESGAGDLLGSAQALSEVLAGLGTARLEETLPTILQNVESSRPTVREGFMSLFIFLPVCFGNSFSAYLGRIVPPILAGLADEVESIRDTALRAGRLLVKNFAARAVDLLLPELERGLADDSYRIRLSSVELVGDLLFNLTGISGKTDANEEEEEDTTAAKDAGATLREVLGDQKRNKILSALYVCRCDTAAAVRVAAISVWKALVHSPRVLKELAPSLTQLIIHRLGSSNMEHKVIASNALGEFIRKAGDSVLSTLLPTLQAGLQITTDTDSRQGICLALKELISSASTEALEDHEKVLIAVVRTALTDSDTHVREAAAEGFDSLQHIFGKRAIDQVLPYLLNLLRSDDDADHALQALLTLLTETTRSNIILPNLIPTLTAPPMSAFNAKALASLSKVAGTAMNRRLPNIIASLLDNIVSCTEESLRADLEHSFDTVLLSIDENDGLNTMMNVLLQLLKHDEPARRAIIAARLAHFFAAAEVDYSRYNQDIVRSLLTLFDDRDVNVVREAWAALGEFTKKLKKEEMEGLVISTRQSLLFVGVAGHDLAGFKLPKGISAILPIFLQGLTNGTTEQRVAAAFAISDIVDRTSESSLKPFVTAITGPLIRVVSERSTEVKAATLLTLNNLLEKTPAALKPFMPQLQRTFAKSLADTSSDVLRTRAAKALGTLIKYTPRVDPLVTELVAGSKTTDPGVRTAMLKALYEVVSKAGTNMGETSRAAVLGLIDTDAIDERDHNMTVTSARLLGALIKNVAKDVAVGILKNRVITPNFTSSSVLALNAVLAEAPDALLNNPLAGELPGLLALGMTHKNIFIADNSILATGKYLLGPAHKTYDNTKALFETLSTIIPPGNPPDTRRLSLVLIRTLCRVNSDLARPHLLLLAPPVFTSVRDMAIPVKLAAEAAFVSLFHVADEEGAVFEKFIATHADELGPTVKRSMSDYFRRIGLRLGHQARERREAEGGAEGALGLAGDEREDEREIWSVGRKS